MKKKNSILMQNVTGLPSQCSTSSKSFYDSITGECIHIQWEINQYVTRFSNRIYSHIHNMCQGVWWLVLKILKRWDVWKMLWQQNHT